MKKYIYALMNDHRHNPMDRIVQWGLWFLSLGYGVIVRSTRALYAHHLLPSYRASKPVISVGNIAVGGAGKTPLVIAIAQAFLARQMHVAILTRGYMPKGKALFSDEARMLQQQMPSVPVMVGANRQKSIDDCLKRHAVDVFICDDAFQHWPLYRDLDIVAIDATNAFGNGHLLPRGILREPIKALARAQVIVLTKTNEPQAHPEALRERLQKINPQALVVESHHACVGCVDVYQNIAYDHYHLKGVSVVAFCGIADPGSFRQSLNEAGFNVANVFVFMDHHVYTAQDMAMVRRFAQDHQIQIIMTTHKDAVKMEPFQEFWQGFKLYYLQVELEFTYGKNVFIERILSAAHH